MIDPSPTWGAPPPPPEQHRGTDPVSVVALVTGLLGVLGVVAIVLGAIGISRTGPAGSGRPAGRGLAVAGLVLGIVEVLGSVVLVITLVALGAAGGVLDEGGDSDTPTVAGATSLAVGDCFDESFSILDDAAVAPRDCVDPHDYEVVSVFTLPEGAYPGDDAVWDQADTRCAADLDAALTRSDLNGDAVDWSWYVPTEDTWAEGDRTVDCLVYAWDENQPAAKLTGSLRDGTLQGPTTTV